MDVERELIEMPPKTLLTNTCEKCKRDFETAWAFQKYCHNPCKSKPPREAEQNCKDRAEAERQRVLNNRSWLSRPL